MKDHGGTGLADEPDGDDASAPQPAPLPPVRKGRIARWTGLAILTLLVAYLLAYPAPIEPLSYHPPPPPPLTGVLEPNVTLRQAERFAVGQIDGPEDVAVDPEGRMIGGTHDGKLVRVSLTGEVETFADTGGRPLGLAWDGAGNLIVADAIKGLLSVDEKGGVSTLTTEAGGIALGFTDDVDVAADGRIYFTDASTKFGYGDHILDMLEAQPYGRLLRYNPRTKQTELLLDGLYFANGVALSQAEEFVLVVETSRHRIRRYWLKGEQAGHADIFVHNLPGYPDGVSSNRRGLFWVAMFTLRNPVADWLSPRPFLKKVTSRLPRFMWPKPQPYGLVLALDEEGEIVRSLHDPGGQQVATITSVEEHLGYLYLGSLTAQQLARLQIFP